MSSVFGYSWIWDLSLHSKLLERFQRWNRYSKLTFSQNQICKTSLFGHGRKFSVGKDNVLGFCAVFLMNFLISRSKSPKFEAEKLKILNFQQETSQRYLSFELNSEEFRFEISPSFESTGKFIVCSSSHVDNILKMCNRYSMSNGNKFEEEFSEKQVAKNVSKSYSVPFSILSEDKNNRIDVERMFEDILSFKPPSFLCYFIGNSAHFILESRVKMRDAFI